MNHDIKRMLELAAKAAGIDLLRADYREHWGFEGARRDGAYIGRWNPGNNDGDSRQLEVRLGLLVDVDWDSRTATAVAQYRADMTKSIVHIVNIPDGSDGMAETRLAVLMAAAAVGEAMP